MFLYARISSGTLSLNLKRRAFELCPFSLIILVNILHPEIFRVHAERREKSFLQGRRSLII